MHSNHIQETRKSPLKASFSQQKSRLKNLKQLYQISTIDTIQQFKNGQANFFDSLQKKIKLQNQKQQRQQFTNQIVSEQKVNKDKQSKRLNNLQVNKLYQYFQQKYHGEIRSDKVQREKINFVQRQFIEIQQKIIQKKQLIKLKKQQQQKILKKKYMQLHNYHQQLKQLQQLVKKQLKLQKNKQKNATKDNLSAMTLKIPSYKENYILIADTITHLKKEIKIIQDDIEISKQAYIDIQQEYIGFLILFINNNHYLNNGIKNILQQLKSMNVTLREHELTSEILDQKAKKFLINYYYHLKNEENTSNKGTLNGDRKRINSNIEMNSLLKQSNLKRIYSTTKDMVNQLLKNSKFKQPSLRQSFLPKITKGKSFSTQTFNVQTRNQSKNQVNMFNQKDYSFEDEMQTEINRINYIYQAKERKESHKDHHQDRGKLIKRILFGFSVK